MQLYMKPGLQLNNFQSKPCKAHASRARRVTCTREYSSNNPRDRTKDASSSDTRTTATAVPDRAEASTPIPQPQKAGRVPSATFFAKESFASIGASEEIVAALQDMGLTKPSHVQAAAYKALNSNARHVVVADHAGSGKTLAYLLPLIQMLREEEKVLGRDAARVPRQPRLLIIAPTNELCRQVQGVARAVGRGAPVRSVGLTGDFKMRTQTDMLLEGVDLVIATPNRLQRHMDLGNIQLNRCRAVVLDEVDILLGGTGGFSEEMAALDLQSKAPEGARFVLVSATLPEITYQELQMQYPGIQAATGPRLHMSTPGVFEQLIDCSGGDEINEETGFLRKAEGLMAVLQGQKAARTIVFCNKIETCRKVENFLKRKEQGDFPYRVLACHAAIEATQRAKNLQNFLREPALGERERMVLVCTDRASRGIDSAFVEHVVLFDFPRDPSEYVRRAGRTARGARGTGVVSILVLGRQVSLAKEIMARNEKGFPIHRVPV